MRKFAAIAWIFLLFGCLVYSQTLELKPSTKRLIIAKKIWVKALCMNKWIDNNVTNSAMVVLKENNQSGQVINDAKVMVNGQMLSFNGSIQEYMGNIGSLSQGQKVGINIKTRDGREVSGYVQVSSFVSISTPTPFAVFSIPSPIPVKWKFSNRKIYQIVFKILKGEIQLFSTDVNGSAYIINLKALGLKVLPGELIRARVISPWSENYHFTGPIATGCKGHFFTSATVTIRVNK